MIRIGSLFSGYGGLDLAALNVFGGEVVWHCDTDKAAARVLEHHWPQVPNLGDVTTVEWDTLPPIDILTGGPPCQDVSQAGRREGLRPDNRSGLVAHMIHAVERLRPKLVIIENVRGLLHAYAVGDVEPCAWCLGDGGTRSLRALGAVLGDLANCGYDARWDCVRASDVGAPHGRHRVFIVAVARDADVPVVDERRQSTPGPTQSRRARSDAGGPSGASSTHAGHGPQSERPWATWRTTGQRPPIRGQFGDNGKDVAADSHSCAEYVIQPWPHAPRNGGQVPADADSSGLAFGQGIRGDARAQREAAQRGGGSSPANPHGTGLREQQVPDAGSVGEAIAAEHGAQRNLSGWGPYEPAIVRWEHVLGRPAPAPTCVGRRGASVLSPAFVEWMQGLPAGHVTDVDGLSRTDVLRLLGNGVVSQQAERAIRLLTPPELVACEVA